ncbi:MAG: hypothetical protein OXM61_02535 [Candidatus Poribacteria bacterium]|nr:hypothetical protein [Candidatus Poribacteria bacterium]
MVEIKINATFLNCESTLNAPNQEINGMNACGRSPNQRHMPYGICRV